MKASGYWLRSSISSALVLVLMAPVAQAVPRQNTQDQQTQPGTPAQTQPQTAPAGNQNQNGAPATQAPPNAPNPQKPANQQTTPTPQPGNPAEPVGTAAAPYEQPVGSAVSRPAGAVIAPAKQKRKHTFLIRMGLVVGAAIAVGTVVALSKASPARPSH